MKSNLLFVLLIDLVYNYITYDTGLGTIFDGVSCNYGETFTGTITFSGEFENVPQVFLAPELLDFDKATTQLLSQITTITKQSFSMLIQCGYSRVITIKYRWFAIDDERIEVINNFNMQPPDDKTFPIRNPNTQYGFVVVTSMHYTGGINFLLSISQITTTSVTVSITKDATKFANLKQIGYQVILGIENIFVKSGLISVTGAYSSGTIPIQSNKWFAIVLQGLNYPSSKNLRLKSIYTNTATTISYTWGTWNEDETPNTHIQVWMVYQFTNVYKALECFTVRSSRKAIYDFNNIPIIYLELLTTNQIFTAVGNYDYVVDKSVSPLNMKIEFICQEGMKIKASFNKCNSCSTQKEYLFTYYCSSQMNYVGFFPKFKQAFQQYNKLKISITAQKLEIIQVVYNQIMTEKSILKVELMNQ